MLSSVCLGTNDIARAGAWYDTVLGTLGMGRLMDHDNELGFGPAKGWPQVYIVRPYNNAPATAGNGTQIAFRAPDQDTVKRFHAAALQAGGTDEGAPGPRDYVPGYYGAYCRDLDGNKLHIFHLPD